MTAGWLLILRRLARRLWVRVAGFAVLALAALGAAVLAEPLLPLALTGLVTAEAVLQVLSILASSMLAVSTFSLGTMVAAHRAAAGNATPRVHRLLLQDGTTQTVLAIFIGAFVYALTAIFLFQAGLYGRGAPVVVMAVTAAVAVVLVLAMLRWIDHLSSLGSMDATLDTTEAKARQGLAQLARWPSLGGTVLTAEAVIPTAAQDLCAPCSGRLQAVDMAALHRLAAGCDVHLWLTRLPGDVVLQGRPLARIGGRTDATQQARMAACFLIGPARSHEQDPGFGLLVLSEIASRALSPGVNDPGTAIDVIARLERMLWDHAHHVAATAPVAYPRLHVPPYDDGDLIEAAFAATARDGAGQIEVCLQLAQALVALEQAGRPALAAAARAMQDRLLDHARRALPVPADQARLTAALAQTAFGLSR